MRHRDAVFGPRTGQADNVFRTDVGRENGGPDYPPAQVASCEKIVGSSFLFFSNGCPGDNQEDGEIAGDGQPIDPGKRRAAYSSGSEHGIKQVHGSSYSW